MTDSSSLRLEINESVRASQAYMDSTDEIYSKQEIVRATPFILPSFAIAGNGDDTPNSETFDTEHLYKRILLMRERAEALFGNKDYEDALLQYRDVLEVALEGGEPLTRDFFNDGYLKMLRADMIAEIYREKEDFTSAIDWLQEIDVLYGCFEKAYEENRSFLKLLRTLEYVTYHMKAALQLVHVFSHLQNTSAAAQFARLCDRMHPRHYPPDIDEIRELRQKSNAKSFYRLKHPDPTRVKESDVNVSSLQIRGVWSKLCPRSIVRPTKRHHCIMWMWRKRIYVIFGVPDKDAPDFTEGEDAWCIDLRELTEWRRLPKIPKRLKQKSLYLEKAIVFKDHAWFFNGSLEIFRFNLITETWNTIETRANFVFPYQPYHQFDSYVELYKNKLCVFSGPEDYKWIRKQIFMLLDLKTLEWENLFPDLNTAEVPYIPPLRYSSITWVSNKEDRFFLMYGHESKHMLSDPSKRKPTIFDELLSYSFKDKVWTRECLRGNYPCHRLNPCCAYYENRDMLILFGGGCQTIPSASPYTTDGSSRNLPYTMLADTFVLDLKTRIWKLVITRNFPAWRTSGLLSIDDTGKIYMHGGMSFRNLHLGEPGDAMKFFCFTDIWRLNIDFPDSSLDEQSFLTPTTSFKAGCWRQCWVCGSIGPGYFQCQGSCQGKYIYCSTACQRASWKTHKTLHGCGKK